MKLKRMGEILDPDSDPFSVLIFYSIKLLHFSPCNTLLHLFLTFKMLNIFFMQNRFISISCIPIKSFMIFGDDLYVVLVKKRYYKHPLVIVHVT